MPDPTIVTSDASPESPTCTRQVVRLVFAAVPPLLVAVLVSVFFTSFNQSLDIYRDIAQKIALGVTGKGLLSYWNIWRELFASFFAVSALSVALWCATYVLIQGVAARHGAGCRAAAVVKLVLPVAIAVLPVWMLGWGMVTSRVSAATEIKISKLVEETFTLAHLELGIPEESATNLAQLFASRLIGYNARLIVYGVVAGLLGLGLIGLFIFLQRRAHSARLLRRRLQLAWLGTGLYGLSVLAVIVTLANLIAAYPVRVADIVQPLPLLCLFAICLLVAMDVLRRVSDLSGLPTLTVVALLAVFFSLADLNDNHAIRYEQVANAPLAKPLPMASDVFAGWLASRDDRSVYAGRRSYPIYIVAAQGGGIYAAHHAAMFLAAVQTQCPNFAHHIFAISGVSGGSVGASVFNAMMREAETAALITPQSGCNTTIENPGLLLSEAVHAVLDDDLWSPLQAALLFPDFLQRFLFWPIASFDRALALERALERAWLVMMNEERVFNPDLKPVTRNLLGEAYALHWDPQKFKNAPALILNTTEVDTGHRRLISPFAFPGTGAVDFLPLQREGSDDKREVLPLSTAAVLSARFPWATPLGWIRSQLADRGSAGKMRLVDGGYFENSGVATALDLIQALTPVIKAPDNVEVNLIVLTSADFVPEKSWLGTGETLGPIQTMLNTRSARGLIEIERAKQHLQRMNSDRIRFRTMEVQLRGLGYPLPLGWRLSTATRYLIEAQRGAADKCKQAADNTAELGEVDCVRRVLQRQLSHASP